MKKVAPMRMVFMVGFYSIMANLAHPIEPTIYTSLGFHDYMFGVAFACMAVTNFALSPFWGKICERYGSAKIMGLSSFGYAFSQYLFAICKTELGIALARVLAGVFISTISVGQLLYIMRYSPKEKATQNLMYNATCAAVMSPVGYLIGGFLGDVSIFFTMMCQVGGLVVQGILFLTILDDDVEPNQTLPAGRELLKEINPFHSFGEIKPYLNTFLWVFFALIAVNAFATTCYEQSFNYLIKAEYGFPASYNGMLKAFVGIVAFTANFTICNWLLHHTDSKHSSVYVLLIQLLMSIGIVLITDLVPFIIINVVFFGFNAVCLPLLQATLNEKARQNNASGIFVGMFNAVRSVGMIGGSLVAGFLYAISYRLPFALTSVLFAVAVILAVVNFRQSKAVKV